MLYKPTVVIYVVGFSTNSLNKTAPVELDINDGLAE